MGSSEFKPLPPIVRVHDICNLVALALLNITNVLYLAGKLNDGHALLYGSIAYFTADMFYVGIWPKCVKSPKIILGHHICSGILILIPLHYPRYIWCLSYCMLVEVNTWLLIAKRTFSVGTEALEVLFYLSWVLLRNIWYPYLTYIYYREWQAETESLGSPWNVVLITPFFQAALTGLNCYWTYNLWVQRSGRRMKQL